MLVISELVLLRVPDRKETKSRRPDGTPTGRLVPHPVRAQGRTPAARLALGNRRGKGPPASGAAPAAVPYPPG